MVGVAQVLIVIEVPNHNSNNNNNKKGGNKGDCYRCGGTNHHPDKCKFKNSPCYVCHKIGHTSRKCTSKDRSARVNFEGIVADEDMESNVQDLEGVYSLNLYRLEAEELIVDLSDCEEDEKQIEGKQDNFSNEENDYSIKKLKLTPQKRKLRKVLPWTRTR